MAAQASGRKYQLHVPLDASRIEGFKPEPVKVLVQGARGPLASTLVRLDTKGGGVATFSFAEPPGSVRVILGPQDATDKELTGLQTVGVDIPAHRWAGQTALKLPPIAIPPYYWYWWLIWCRTFTICGHVVCPDGSPVVGATVCAYDVDWWWWYSSTQQIACATTDINGAFCIKFKWCCGWWPWWWWETRFWQLDPALVERVMPVLQRNPDLHRLIQPKAQPSFNDFRELLGAEAAHLSSAAAIDPASLATLREPLLRRLPPELELEKLKIWPWYPWYPWTDCAPDVIFKVTQDCTGSGVPAVIVNETIWDTRPDIPTTLNNVTLVATSTACCVHPHNNCPGIDCMVLTTACGDTVDHIGGNVGALPTPVGHHNPNDASVYSDQPYAGTIPIGGIADCLSGYDYYEFEWATSGTGPWNLMPPNANGGFARTYFDAAAFGASTPPYWVSVPFVNASLPSTVGIRNVYETPQHYEANNSPAAWTAITRAWVTNYDQLINWQTLPSFGDGTYYLQLKGWKYNTGTNQLDNPNILDICGGATDNYVVLTVDNQIVLPGPIDAHGNPCTSVHACTNEPDTAILSITILPAAGGSVPVAACGIYNVKWPDRVQIDFVAHDPDGYLAEYGLNTHYGINLSRDLLALTSTLSPGPAWGGPGPVPAALQQGPRYYPEALSQSATRPFWTGGVMRLVLPATDDPSNATVAQGAFPVSCCYQLRLDAWKRTIVNCTGHFTNTSETSFTINVVP